MSNQAGIYKLTSPSGKVYIGQAYDLDKNILSTNISNGKKIKIDQYDLEGNFIKTWESAKDAARELNISSVGNISSVCRGSRKSTGGFMFKYNNELECYNSKAKKK